MDDGQQYAYFIANEIRCKVEELNKFLEANDHNCKVMVEIKTRKPFMIESSDINYVKTLIDIFR